jgi:hypothetical protein
MDVDEAVKIAKDWVNHVYKEEEISNVGLEEVKFGSSDGLWYITIGFSRPWNVTRNAMTIISGESGVHRTLKIVAINDNDKKVVALTNKATE